MSRMNMMMIGGAVLGFWLGKGSVLMAGVGAGAGHLGAKYMEKQDVK